MKHLSPWNPLDHLRLLWWTLVTPQQLKAYREQYGQKAEQPTAKWLVSTLIWLPFFLPFSVIGFGIVPFSPYTFPGITLSTTYYFWGSASLFIAWFLTGIFGNNKGRFTIEQYPGFLLGLLIGVLPAGLLGALVLGTAGFVSIGLAGGFALGLARKPVMPLAGSLMLGFMFGLGAGLWLGLGGKVVLEQEVFDLVLVLVLILGGGLPLGLGEVIQKSLKTGEASWVARGVFVLLIAGNAFLVWYSYLGGWRVF